jgi:hypothetical protein
MKVGVVFPQTEIGPRVDAVRRYAVTAEELGFLHLLAYDHVVGADHADREPALWGPYTEKDSFHDPLVAFGYLAAITFVRYRLVRTKGAPS